MATAKLSNDVLQESLNLATELGIVEAGRRLGISHTTVSHRRRLAKLARLVPQVVRPAPEAVAQDPLEEWRRAGGPQQAWTQGIKEIFKTKEDHTFTFGACGDQHMGSKYERLDCLEWLYDAYEEAGCEVVFNTGNWIDGEARFNMHDLHTHGLDGQLDYLVANYPERDGMTTYAVAGDDHEGWYAQREGLDIGGYAERKFHDAGREDWVDLGYMEAPVGLENSSSGKRAVISVVHPGGGTAYALSYAIQKMPRSGRRFCG